MKHEVLQSLLIDVRDTGSAKVDKGKLAWMLGRININASAYGLLLDEWQLVAQAGQQLFILIWGDHVTLSQRRAESVQALATA